MLAVDPSSRRSGGALLGDRARIEFDPADRGVFIRSTAAGERLGGLAWGTRAAAQALAAAFDVVVVETVGVGQAETEVAEVADTVAVVVQPGSGDVLQFLKSGIMEIPDVLIVTKADLGQVATSARRDLSAALRSLGRRSTAVAAVSSLPPPTGIDELRDLLDERWSLLTADGGVELATRRLRARRAGALTDFAVEHGERGLRALGGRRAAERWLAAQDPALDEAALAAALEGKIRPDGARRQNAETDGMRRQDAGLMARDLATMLGAFVAASALAGALGAVNLGTALAFGQIGFAIALVYVLLRR